MGSRPVWLGRARVRGARLLDVVKALLEHLVLPGEVAQLRLEHVQPALGVLQRHLVLLVVGQLVPQLLHLLERARQRLRQLLVLLRDLEHQLLVGDLLLLHVGHLVLEGADQVEVVVRDIVVVVLDLAEGLLVLLHQLVDVVVLRAARPPAQTQEAGASGAGGCSGRSARGGCDAATARARAGGGNARAGRLPPREASETAGAEGCARGRARSNRSSPCAPQSR